MLSPVSNVQMFWPITIEKYATPLSRDSTVLVPQFFISFEHFFSKIVLVKQGVNVKISVIR